MDSVIVDSYIEWILVDENKHSLLIDKEGNRVTANLMQIGISSALWRYERT